MHVADVDGHVVAVRDLLLHGAQQLDGQALLEIPQRLIALLETLAHEQRARQHREQPSARIEQQELRREIHAGEHVGIKRRLRGHRPGRDATHPAGEQPAARQHVERAARQLPQDAGVQTERPGARVIGNVEPRLRGRDFAVVGLATPALHPVVPRQPLVHRAAHERGSLDRPGNRHARSVEQQVLLVLRATAVLEHRVVDVHSIPGAHRDHVPDRLAVGDHGEALGGLRLGRGGRGGGGDIPEEQDGERRLDHRQYLQLESGTPGTRVQR